jgi:hypothetical protein
MDTHWLYQNRIQMPRSWQDSVRAAETEADVLDLVKDFVAQFSPSEIAQLPPACRPGKFHDAGDVTEYAFDLVRHRCEEGEESADTIHRLSAFFTDANQRLSELLHAHFMRPDRDHRQSA